MTEYYRVLILVYIVGLVILLLHPVAIEILHSKTIERRPDRDDIFTSHRWRWRLKDGSYKNIGETLDMAWWSVFIVLFVGFASPAMLIKTEKLWPYWSAITIYLILISAPLFIYIYNNLSISISWAS